jgi:anti-sigma regulatory factor (Ser/Thr protein kinase)
VAVDWYLQGDDAAAASALRREVMGYLHRHAAEGSNLPDAELAVSELLANVSRHAPGPAWVTLGWRGPGAVMTVHDLGPGFELPTGAPDPLAESGRGLFMVSALAMHPRVVARAGEGAAITVELPVRRPATPSFDPPHRSVNPLPSLGEAEPDGGFGRESFLRALVVQLAQAVEQQHGPEAAEAAVAQVGLDVGGQMEEEFRRARAVTDRLTSEQLGECYVRLKHAVDGGFRVLEADEHRVVLVNDRCPFGEAVRRAPALCRMTSSVFGGIAARNRDDGAWVILDERIALGDPGCRVVVHLGTPPEEDRPVAHRYRSPEERPAG